MAIAGCFRLRALSPSTFRRTSHRAGKLIHFAPRRKSQSPSALCSTGMRRSLALAEQYLGKGASKPLFEAAEKPDAFLAITLHTLETASPSAQSLAVCRSSIIPRLPIPTAAPLAMIQRCWRSVPGKPRRYNVAARLASGRRSSCAVWEHQLHRPRSSGNPAAGDASPWASSTSSKQRRPRQVAAVKTTIISGSFDYAVSNPPRSTSKQAEVRRRLRGFAAQRLGRAGEFPGRLGLSVVNA